MPFHGKDTDSNSVSSTKQLSAGGCASEDVKSNGFLPRICSYRLRVRSPSSQDGDTGSNPVKNTKWVSSLAAMTGDCKSPLFGVRRFESYLAHKNKWIVSKAAKSGDCKSPPFGVRRFESYTVHKNTSGCSITEAKAVLWVPSKHQTRVRLPLPALKNKMKMKS